ncbi:nucleotidyl transferase AbiEii/AbiGii toxin family protein [Loigolactobacillus coryniformis]|uniref:nucleotidyl transferase AbiEii/AbiGii toxin family protein n=1 Tax=Loigolactobacillus coryniformis TaxID=1610 RepID=UPI002FEE8321
MINDVLKVSTDSGMEMKVISVSNIMEGSSYPGLRMKIMSNLGQMHDRFKIDVITGDSIVPEPEKYQYPRMFGSKYDKSTLEIYTYPQEQVLAEKLQTILDRGAASTRSRDYYDVYALQKYDEQLISYTSLNRSYKNIMKVRGTDTNRKQRNQELDKIEHNPEQIKSWDAYSNKYEYNKGLKFSDVMGAVKSIFNNMDRNELERQREMKRQQNLNRE